MGGWEHECCGTAFERDALVDLGCLRTTDVEGRGELTATHHHLDPEVRVRGRVRDLLVLRADGPPEPVLRVPGGLALRGFDPDDDGHLEDPWTGRPLAAGEDFLVVVATRGGRRRR